MAATSTMHLGPEWMRAKTQPCTTRHQAPPSPPPQSPSAIHQLNASTYSALVTPLAQEPDKHDESRPFRYTKDDLLRIYKEGGGRGGLNLEVERWEGIVRDIANEPAALREMTEAEKKLFAGPLNSDLRRRQSMDLVNTLSLSDRQRSIHSNSSANNTVRYGPFSARRRDSTDQPPLTLPRKLSLSNTQGATILSPRDALPSPRNRIGAFGPGFDGVLNNGDAWSRRRASTGVVGASSGAVARGDGREEDARHAEIREEEESVGRQSPNAHDVGLTAVTDLSSSPGPNVSPPHPMPDGRVSSLGFDSAGQSITGLSLEAQNQFNSNLQVSSTINPLPSGLPPGLTDLASIEWSYLDPQGQVQGPFRADLMQKWFDEGYFTPDLLVRRTRVDVDWIAVGILERRTAGGKIFLPQISNGPPGLSIHTESPKSYSPVHERDTFNGYQSIPIQSLRTTLDSSLNGSPVESPSSSLGGGRLGSSSPDPLTFAGSNAYSSDSNFGGRTFAGRVFQDSLSDVQTFGNNFLARAPTVDTRNASSGGGDTSPWSAGPGQVSQGFNDNEQHPYSGGLNSVAPGTMGNSLVANHIHGANQEHFGDATCGSVGSLSTRHDPSVARQLSDADGISFNNNSVNGLGSQFGVATQFLQSASLPYVAPQHHQSVSPYGDQTSDGPSVAHPPTSALQPNNSSPWNTRSRAFESPVTPSPVVPPARPQSSEWIAPQPVSSVDPSPWFIASLPIADDVWKEVPGPNSLTFSNLGQHNKLQQQEEETDDIVVSHVEDAIPPPLSTQPPQSQSTNAMTASAMTMVPQPVPLEIISAPAIDSHGSATPKARRKSTRDVQTLAAKTVPPPAPIIVKDHSLNSSLPATQPKPVWAIDDDSKKQKGIGAMISLREIQEAEAKKAEARKAAEKERERLARPNASGGNFVVEESQPFTSSWGLPTSQVGVRNQVLPKETVPSASTVAPATPVWTNATSPVTVKKTMKEIQEEEERRKKVTVKESMASAASRRAYAETTLKVVPSAQGAGGPWTTVGPNGKPTVPVTGVPRPPANAPPNSPTPTTTPRASGGANRQVVATTVKATAPRVDDFPVTPSHDFLRWLGESLKGLNSAVNLEEITSMLLSFPLDPDQSTLEIISDLIYANSTTLDGRRFASEYVSKRKADAAARRGTAGALGPSNKAVSIADVVKTQPKPVQQEWGFKVVNKKKKGGRS